VVIKVERIEIAGINVHDVAAAEKKFSELFGIEFLSAVMFTEAEIVHIPPKTGEKAEDPRTITQPTRISIDTKGYFELVESHEDSSRDRMRNIHFKVPDIDEAIAEMQSHGVRLVANVLVGTMREAVFEADDLFGLRICLVEYSEPSLIEALVAKTPDSAVRRTGGTVS
jgi:catechol 2,3-dioxygenase-like lactoylglutathione lyase family enzyme